MFFVIN